MLLYILVMLSPVKDTSLCLSFFVPTPTCQLILVHTAFASNRHHSIVCAFVQLVASRRCNKLKKKNERVCMYFCLFFEGGSFLYVLLFLLGMQTWKIGPDFKLWPISQL